MATNEAPAGNSETFVSELSPRAQAQKNWQNAMKQRAKVLRSIESLKKGAHERFEKEQFDKLEATLAQFRLGFVYILAQDLAYAFEEDAEDVVWKLHIFVNIFYRELVQGKLRGGECTVTRRKVEKAWVTFLKTAIGFYRTYFERLQELHGMPQIPRINRALQLDGPTTGTAQDSRVSPKAVEKSFHSTLLHLGDISRWKAQARPNASGSNTATLYYELAHDLNPTSGLAHHQLGIMEDSNHLQVVYHLYRAAAIESPHPNALTNLEHEFRKLSTLSQPRRTFPLDPNSAFADWFCKLHAYLYKGETYPQELEEEVLHRLETALKKPDALSLVLKMVLTNTAAYFIALSKIKKEWSLKASSSCQFILRLNVRWIVVLLRLLQTELQDFAKSAAPASDDSEAEIGEGAQSPTRSSVFTDTLLPLSRIYLAWLYIHRTDVVGYQDHLGPYIFEMYKLLASSLTVMANEFNSGLVESSPYLLTEDAEALGMKPFDDATLEQVCNFQHVINNVSFKRHWEDCDTPRQPPEQEMLSRIYDWITCGFALALNQRFPLSIGSGPGKAITVTYLEEGKPEAPTIAVTRPGQGSTRPGSQALHPVIPVNENDVFVPQMDALYDGPGGDSILVPVDALPRPNSGRNSPTINDLLEAEPNSGIKQRMRSLVDDLLDGDNSDNSPQAERRASTLRQMSSPFHFSTTAQDMGSRSASTLQAFAPPFSLGLAPHSGYERGPGRLPSGVSGSGSSGLAHERQRFGGSMDSFYSGVAPYQPGASTDNGLASRTKQADGRVDSVSLPIFGFNSSWTRAFDPNASSLPPPVNSPWGLPGAQLGAQPAFSPDGAIAQQDAPADYQHYTAAQGLIQSQTVSNGSAYNGSTAYGRSGLPTPNFRNAV